MRIGEVGAHPRDECTARYNCFSGKRILMRSGRKQLRQSGTCAWKVTMFSDLPLVSSATWRTIMTSLYLTSSPLETAPGCTLESRRSPYGNNGPSEDASLAQICPTLQLRALLLFSMSGRYQNSWCASVVKKMT